MTSLNSRDLKTAIQIDIETGIVPMIKGSPGIGKSAMMRGIADAAELMLIVVHGSMLEPTDVNGFPDVGGEYARFKTFEMFPVVGMSMPINPKTGTAYKGWLLFLDEVNSASIETQAAFYSLILDHKAGQKELHENCYIVAAGNLKTDNAIVNTQSSAMTSRLVHYEMAFDPSVFLEDVVEAQKWDTRVAAYLEWKPEMCHVFDPNKAEDPYACPRTWDFLQRRIQTQDALQIPYEEKVGASTIQRTGYNNKAKHNRASAEGLLGSVIAGEFIAFVNTFGQIPSTDDVINDPQGTPIPDTKGLQFGTIVQLRRDVDIQNIDDIYVYVQRFDPEFRIVFLKGIVSTKGIPRSHPVIVDAQRNLRRRP